MKKFLAVLFGILLAYLPTMAFATVGIIYVASTGTATNSGTTNATSPVISGTAATWTTATNAIVLDVNTNIGSVPGCSAGTCDGSQAIYLANATNTSTRIFWIASYTGCTGTGACTVTTSGTPAAPACTVCTAVVWSIGGQYLSPSGATANLIAGALRAGDTVLFVTDAAAKSTNFIQSAGVPGDVVTGPITIKGQIGTGTGTCPGIAGATVTCPKLPMSSGSANAIQIAVANWTIDTLDIEATGSTGSGVLPGVHTIVRNSKIVGGANSLGSSSVYFLAINNDLSGATSDCITTSSGTVYLYGNYIHGCTGNAFTGSSASLSLLSMENIVTGNAKGFFLSGTCTTQTTNNVFEHNVVYDNSGDGLGVSNANCAAVLTNNVFQDNGQTSGYNVNLASGGSLAMVHTNNVFYQSGAGTPTGNLNNLTPNSNEPTTSPGFVNPSGSNFAVTSAGAALGAGTPTTWGTASTQSYPNIGVAASQSGGGLPSHVIGVN